MVGISNFCNVGPGFEHWLINHATLSLALGNQKLQGKNHPCTNGFPGFPLFFANTHVENTGIGNTINFDLLLNVSNLNPIWAYITTVQPP